MLYVDKLYICEVGDIDIINTLWGLGIDTS